MNKTLAVLLMTVLSSAIFAGCIGDGFGGSGAPRAVVSVSEVAGEENTFRFDASGSSGSSLSYDWELGDGTTATDAVVQHTYEYGSGTYSARLVIEDSAGTPDVWEGEIEVGDGSNSPPVAFFKPAKRNYEIDEPVRVDASASTDPEGDPLTYRWDFNHLMDFDEYMQFRSDRAQALEGADDGDFSIGGGDNGSGKSSSGDLMGPPYDALRERDPTGLLGNKHAGHGDGGNDIDASLFSHNAETEEPVYTLEEGFPDETVFFIRLQVYDVKGDHEEILSEEIWPVEVWNNPPEPFISDNETGEFDFGASAEVTDAISDSGLGGDEFQYEYTWEFVIDWPLAPSKRDGLEFTPGGQITLRWEAESDAAGVSSIVMTVTPPNGEELSSFSLESSQGERVELDGSNDYVDGNWETPWKVHIIAREGLNLSWDLDYWMNLDTNPFFEFEEDYL